MSLTRGIGSEAAHGVHCEHALGITMADSHEGRRAIAGLLWAVPISLGFHAITIAAIVVIATR